MKETQDFMGKKVEQKSRSPGASDSGNCAAPGGMVPYVSLMPRLSRLDTWLEGKLC